MRNEHKVVDPITIESPDDLFFPGFENPFLKICKRLPARRRRLLLAIKPMAILRIAFQLLVRLSFPLAEMKLAKPRANFVRFVRIKNGRRFFAPLFIADDKNTCRVCL